MGSMAEVNIGNVDETHIVSGNVEELVLTPINCNPSVKTIILRVNLCLPGLAEGQAGEQPQATI